MDRPAENIPWRDVLMELQATGETLRRNLDAVLERIDAAARRSGRSWEDITLVAVTKTIPAEVINLAVDAGVRDIGENRVQEALAKRPQVREGVRWHLIGHLQRNKVRHVLDSFDLIHSVDRESLVDEIARRAMALGREVDVLVQVNASGEETKGGADPGILESLCRYISNTGLLRVRGLMTMAPLCDDPEEVRPVFRRVREEAQRLSRLGLPRVSMEWLSMGMSGDFEAAIEEGANMVRIGRAIFGARH